MRARTPSAPEPIPATTGAAATEPVSTGVSHSFTDLTGNIQVRLGVEFRTTGYRFGTWTTHAAGARGSILLRIVGTSGNASADPFVTNLSVELR